MVVLVVSGMNAASSVLQKIGLDGQRFQLSHPPGHRSISTSALGPFASPQVLTGDPVLGFITR